MHARHAVIVAVIVSAGAGFACGGTDEAGLGPTDVVGTWSGSTSQDKNLSFTVAAGGVTQSTFTYVLQGSRCFYTSTLNIPTTEPIDISKGHFSLPSTQLGVSLFVSATGDFTSDTAATGTLRIEDGQCGDTLALTWTAKRGQ